MHLMHCNTLKRLQATCSYIDSFLHAYTYVAALPGIITDSSLVDVAKWLSYPTL